MSRRSRDERTKLLAYALDRASTACFTVGIASPAAAYLYNVGGLRASIEAPLVAVFIVAWFAAALSLHLVARRVLMELDDE